MWPLGLKSSFTENVYLSPLLNSPINFMILTSPASFATLQHVLVCTAL